MLFLLVILEATVFDYIRFFAVKPDAVLLVVIFTGLFGGFRKGAEAGIAGGFLLDIFGICPFGTGMILYGICGAVSGLLSNRFYKESMYTQIIFASLFAVVISIFFAVSKSSLPRLDVYSYNAPLIQFKIFIVIIYNALICPLMFAIYFRIFGLRRTY